MVGWLDGWSKRIKIIIDHNDIDAALTDFPHLVYLSASSGQSNKDVSCVFDELGSDANRKKIAVTTNDGLTQCYVEIEHWDHANEKAWLWVKVPDLDPDENTEFFFYYDHSKAENTAYVGDPSDDVVHNVWDEHFCYDEMTEVLTDQGWKFFKNLDRTELVATLNPNTDELEYQKPTAYISYNYKGKMFKIVASNLIDLLVIPEHRMYVAERVGDHSWSDYHLVPAKDIFSKEVKYKKDAKWIGEEKQYFVLPSITDEYWLSNQYQKRHTMVRKVLPEILIDMDVWLEFFGYYISKGKVTYETELYDYHLYITQISHSEIANPEIREKIENCLKKLPFKYSKEFQCFRIYNKQLASYLRQFGKSEDRFIPSELKKLSKRQLQILFDALVEVEGAKGEKPYLMKSKRLARSST